MKHDCKRNRKESGMALVMVLGILAVAMLIVVHVLSLCETVSRESYVESQKIQLRYLAESGQEESYWMHLTDRRLHSSRKLGQGDEKTLENSDNLRERWMADRRIHWLRPELLQKGIRSYIGDPLTTLRINQTGSFKENLDLEDTEMNEVIDRFLDVLGDYTDSDDARKLNGKEADDYAEEGYMAMPRNRQMQFAEEVYWLENWQEALLDQVTIIPPDGKNLPQATKPNFFSANEQQIRLLLREQSDESIEAVLEAQRLWTRNGIPLDESLSSDLQLTVSSKFSFQETDLAQYFAVAENKERSIRVICTVIRECNPRQSTIYADRSAQTLSIWKSTLR